MFDLKANNNNLMVIKDQCSNTAIGLMYRTPTTDERIEFKSAMIDLVVKKKDIKEIVKAKLKFAKDLVTGIRDGDLGYDGKTISTESGKPNYRADWYELLAEHGSHILEKFVETILGDYSAQVVEETRRPFVK